MPAEDLWRDLAPWRRDVAKVEPTVAHQALAAFEKSVASQGVEVTIITQNVDGLHHRAGNRKVVELHGNITRTKCFDEGTVVTSWKDAGDVPPKCPNCGGLLRPDVVWFEEPLPEAEIEQATAASNACDVFLCVGTSALVFPAAALPFVALRNSATVVEINPEETLFTSEAHFALVGNAGVVLPELVKALKRKA
jgi:NAD-dependent deacetylase